MTRQSSRQIDSKSVCCDGRYSDQLITNDIRFVDTQS